MEVTAARRFSPKSEEPQTVSPKLKTMEPSEKTAAASEGRGNVKKTKKTKQIFTLSCWVARKMLTTFLLRKGHSWFTRKLLAEATTNNSLFLSTSFSLEITRCECDLKPGVFLVPGESRLEEPIVVPVATITTSAKTEDASTKGTKILRRFPLV